MLLLGEGPNHTFQPANLEVAFRGSDPEAHSKPEKRLLRQDVTFVPDPAAKISLDERTILTGTGKKYDYDKLVLATGAEASPDMIPGLAAGSYNFHTGPQNASKVWSALQSFKGGRVAVAIAGIPHKCPPSPDEAIFMLDQYFRKRGIRDKVDLVLVTPYPRPYPAEKVSRVVERLFEERGVETVPFFNVDSVDPEVKKIYSLEGSEEGYDLLIAVPPHRGTAVIRESGIGDEEGWIPTERRNMRIKGYDDAFAIGDATDIPISKSGVVAHLESSVVALNLAEDMNGRTVEYEYNGRINCPMEVGGRHAIFVSATYEKPPADQQPSLLKYAMKKGFGSIYWSTVRGSWGWLMDAYFGETAEKVERSPPKENQV